MQTITDNEGLTVVIPENILERRSFVTGLLIYDEENGIAASQRARYELPNWAYVAGLLVGQDKSDKGALTCYQISDKLKPHGIHLKPNAIYRIIQAMKRPRRSVKTCIRAHGQSCKEVVEQMGEILEYTVNHTNESGVTYEVQAYYFGADHAEVVRLRRAYAQMIQINPFF